MKYKGYVARIEYSDEDDSLIGHIAGINDVVGFHADNVQELHKAFEEAVDDYLETCKKLHKKPNKPYPGKFLWRTTPEKHAKAATAAAARGESLNSFLNELIDQIQ